MDNIQKIKCGRCKVLLPSDHFSQKRSGDFMKCCMECNRKNREYDNSNKCPHNKRKNRCIECKGVSMCEHARIRSTCKDCGGSEICEHSRKKNQCKDCKGSTMCEHGKRKYTCVKCGGSTMCEHNRVKYKCIECRGSAICEHNKIKYLCKKCGGSSICEHNRQKFGCKICDPAGHLACIVRNHVYRALIEDKELCSQEYLGCTIEEFREHIEDKFAPGMTWENYGTEWEIDHIVPLKYKENGVSPSLEETIKRLHYLNTQPLWSEENASKSNRRIF